MNTSLKLNSFAFLLLLIFYRNVSATPIHDHCDKQSWQLPTQGSGIVLTPRPEPPAKFPLTDPTTLKLDVHLPLTKPESQEDGCSYELSDLTFVTLTLDILNINKPDELGNQYQFTFNPPGPKEKFEIIFLDDKPQNFTFPTHESGILGDIHLTFPDVLFDFTLKDGKHPGELKNTLIRGASMAVSGNHYFRQVTEPPTFVLFTIALVGLIRQTSRRR